MTDFTLDGQPPHLRDSMTHPWGVFLAWSMGHGGEQAFHWFATEGEAIAFIVSTLGDVYDRVSWPTEAEVDAATAWMEGEFHRLSEMPLDLINDTQPVVQVRWADHVDDLLSSTSRFAWEVRADFFPFTQRNCPIGFNPGNRRFHDHLRSYVKRFPEQRYQSPFSLTARDEET